MMVLGAWLVGLWRMCRSAWLVPVVYVLLLVATVPLTLVLHRDLPQPSTPSTIEPGAGPVPDYEWLDDATANKRSLVGALAPEVIGVAAPFQNLDQFLEGRAPLFSVLVSAAMLTVWAWLWGGVLTRVGGGTKTFLTACQQSFSELLALSVASVGSALLISGVLRWMLFGMVHALMGGSAESTVFVARLAATVIIVAIVAMVTLVFDYARIAVVLDDVSLKAGLVRGLRTVKTNSAAVLMLVVLFSAALAVVLAGYAAFEFIPGGSVPTVTRIILLGQAYILARIVLRVWNAAAQAELYRRCASRAASE